MPLDGELEAPVDPIPEHLMRGPPKIQDEFPEMTRSDDLGLPEGWEGPLDMGMIEPAVMPLPPLDEDLAAISWVVEDLPEGEPEIADYGIDFSAPLVELPPTKKPEITNGEGIRKPLLKPERESGTYHSFRCETNQCIWRDKPRCMKDKEIKEADARYQKWLESLEELSSNVRPSKPPLKDKEESFEVLQPAEENFVFADPAFDWSYASEGKDDMVFVEPVWSEWGQRTGALAVGVSAVVGLGAMAIFE